MNSREGWKPTVRLTTLTLTTKIFICPSLLSFLPSLCISALFPMPALHHLNSRHIWYVWIIYTAVISPLPSHQSGTIIKQNAQVNSNPHRAALNSTCVFTCRHSWILQPVFGMLYKMHTARNIQCP